MKNVQCKRCVNLRNEWCDKKIDSPDIELIRDCQYYRAKTNADSIRAMTDEELAGWLERIRLCCTTDLCGRSCPFSQVCYSNAEEPKEMLDWLKQEV